ncbi:hypothetical protein GGR56DRAFT_429375 [Xylariaceae sp. FL0804]|nr:hypothetical protein GGR56DRAFT_429375 [Xylariaceae sp. FL0804]
MGRCRHRDGAGPTRAAEGRQATAATPLRAVFDELGMSKSLKDVGVGRDRWDRLDENSLAGSWCKTNPVPTDVQGSDRGDPRDVLGRRMTAMAKTTVRACIGITHLRGPSRCPSRSGEGRSPRCSLRKPYHKRYNGLPIRQ